MDAGYRNLESNIRYVDREAFGEYTQKWYTARQFKGRDSIQKPSPAGALKMAARGKKLPHHSTIKLHSSTEYSVKMHLTLELPHLSSYYTIRTFNSILANNTNRSSDRDKCRQSANFTNATLDSM